jgi:hypothetical protein
MRLGTTINGRILGYCLLSTTPVVCKEPCQDLTRQKHVDCMEMSNDKRKKLTDSFLSILHGLDISTHREITADDYLSAMENLCGRQ